MKYYQQGDVLIKSASIPKEARRIHQNILKIGETTGHAHVVDLDAEIFECEGQLYFRNEAEVEIVHEEHAPITVPPGEWIVDSVREFDPFSEEVRSIQD